MPLAGTIEDPRLREAVPGLWERSRDIHSRQQSPGSLSGNGRKHCLCVELRMHEVVQACCTQLSDCDRALLSSAACCHDYRRSLDREQLSEFDGDHGTASASIVHSGPHTSELDPRLRSSLAHIVELHTCPATEFHRRLGAKPSSPPDIGGWGNLSLPLCAVLIYLANTPDATMDRLVPGSEVAPDEGAVFRGATWHVQPERMTITVVVHYADDEQKDTIEKGIAYVRENEFDPLKPLLETCRLPRFLHWEVEADAFAPGSAPRWSASTTAWRRRATMTSPSSSSTLLHAIVWRTFVP